MDLRGVNEAKIIRAQAHVELNYLESKQNVLVQRHRWAVRFELGDHELQHL